MPSTPKSHRRLSGNAAICACAHGWRAYVRACVSSSHLRGRAAPARRGKAGTSARSVACDTCARARAGRISHPHAPLFPPPLARVATYTNSSFIFFVRKKMPLQRSIPASFRAGEVADAGAYAAAGRGRDGQGAGTARGTCEGDGPPRLALSAPPGSALVAPGAALFSKRARAQWRTACTSTAAGMACVRTTQQQQSEGRPTTSRAGALRPWQGPSEKTLAAPPARGSAPADTTGAQEAMRRPQSAAGA